MMDGEVKTPAPKATLITEETEFGNPFQTGAAYLYKNLESYPGQLQSVPSIMSSKREQKISRKEAVKGARHVERTNEHVRGGIDRKVNMVVGAKLRISAQPQAELIGMVAGWSPERTKQWRKQFSRQCETWFHDWAYSKRCTQDGERHYNFGGLMWQAYRGIVGPDAATAGFIGYDQERADKYHSRWATFLTLIDPDRINTPPGKDGDKNVFEGRKMDRWGAMEGFWATKGHPSEGGLEAMEYEYIPRETEWGRPFGFHWFMKFRAGAQHGVTSLITTLRHSTMLDRYDDARLGAAILQEMFAFYAKSEADAETVAAAMAPGKDGASVFDHKLDFYGKAKIRIGQHRAALLPPGDDLELLTSNRAAGDTTPFVNQFLRKIAMALDLPFEQFANDYSQANYSSIRASLLDAWRGVEVQRQMFGQHVPALCYDAVIEEAIFKGRILLPDDAPPFNEYRDAYTSCSITGPGMGWIDPLKEAKAAMERINGRLSTRKREAAAAGEDWVEIFNETDEEYELAEELGITLDPMPAGGANTDPNNMTDDPDENPASRSNPGGE